MQILVQNRLLIHARPDWGSNTYRHDWISPVFPLPLLMYTGLLPVNQTQITVVGGMQGLLKTF